MIRKTLLASLAFGIALVAIPAVAGAHVEIAKDAALGADGTIKVTVSAENECANNGNLTSVELIFPDSPPLTTATPDTVAGWTAAVTKRTGSENVDKVVWTNSGNVGGPGTFPMTLGTVPQTAKAVDFKALDTCDNGEVTRWVQPGESSEFPAPVLAIKESSGGDTGTTTTTEAAATKSNDDSSTGLVIGIIAGVVVVLGGGAFLLMRRKNASA